MERTLHIGDRVLAVRFLYHFENPHRGDILVFHPNGIGDTALAGNHVASVTYIKRLIGLPGDWVQAANGHVQICTGPPGEGCKTLKEPYVSSTQQNFGPIHVPAGHYFMMGDNREFSDDSRDWGSIKKSQIIGRAFMTYWPPDADPLLLRGLGQQHAVDEHRDLAALRVAPVHLELGPPDHHVDVDPARVHAARRRRRARSRSRCRTRRGWPRSRRAGSCRSRGPRRRRATSRRRGRPRRACPAPRSRAM